VEDLIEALEGDDDSRVLLISADGDELLMEAKLDDSEDLVEDIAEAMPATEYGGDWQEDFTEATALAGQLDRPILLNFSGSDWCGWCMRLDEEVLSTEAFETFARENLVLAVADFPRETPQSEELRTQNAGLLQRFGVQGFPTIIVLDADGAELGRLGYQPGGPEPFIEAVSGLIAVQEE